MIDYLCLTVSLKQLKSNTVTYGLNLFRCNGETIWRDRPYEMKNSITMELNYKMQKGASLRTKCFHVKCFFLILPWIVV